MDNLEEDQSDIDVSSAEIRVIDAAIKWHNTQQASIEELSQVWDELDDAVRKLLHARELKDSIAS